jgi:hypothetical protein
MSSAYDPKRTFRLHPANMLCLETGCSDDGERMAARCCAIGGN